MAIAITLNEYLSKKHIPYELVRHHHTESSLDTCAAAHVPTDQVAKAVILRNDEGDYLMAVLPAGHRLSLAALNNQMGKDYHLVNEHHLASLFPDCDKGAIPSMGEAYGMQMLVDDALLKVDDVYIEAGDHMHLLKIDHLRYSQMLKTMPHGDISGAAIGVPKFADHLVRDW